MPQTDTAAILETVSYGRGEGRRGGGTAAGGGEASRGNGCLGEGAGTAQERGEREGEEGAAREGDGRGAGRAGPRAGKGRRAGRGRREEPAGRITWGRYKRPKPKREEDWKRPAAGGACSPLYRGWAGRIAGAGGAAASPLHSWGSGGPRRGGEASVRRGNPVGSEL